MEVQTIRYSPAASFMTTSMPGNNRFRKLYDYNIYGPKGTYGVVKTSIQNRKSYDVGAGVMQTGHGAYPFKVPRIRPDPRAKFVPRSGGIMRVVGTSRDEDPLSFVDFNTGVTDDAILKKRNNMTNSIFGVGTNYNDSPEYAPLFSAPVPSEPPVDDFGGMEISDRMDMS